MSRAVVALAATALLALLEAIAEARPGGGQSYSGGGGHGGGSGGGGGGGELVYFIIRLIIIYPHVGIPVAVVVGGVYIHGQRQKRRDADWDSGPPVHQGPPPRVESLGQHDPDFSIVTFDDFCYRLYAQAHCARTHPNAMAGMAPYLSEPVRAALMARAPQNQPVFNVVVGAMRAIDIDLPPPPDHEGADPGYVHITLELEANMTAGAEDARTYFVVEQWTLARAAGVRSRPPGGDTTFPCPNCGAPFQSSDGARCEYCSEVVNNGRFDWLVVAATLTHQDVRPPALTGTIQERGTDLPTYEQPGVHQRWMSLQHDDPAITDQGFGNRLGHLFAQINDAWSRMDQRALRPHVSDGMFDYLRYWLGAYQAQGLRNVAEDAVMSHWTLARVTRDRYFDAVTVRIWARGKDYTVSADGEVVGGSRSRERSFSEYWTLIRRAGTRGAPSATAQCPNCGAPLQINAGGTCEHCSAHVTAGEFDWVLSKIEQDDSYRG